MTTTTMISVSLSDELYEWAVREVEAGKAESVSSLIVESLDIRRARAELESLVADLTADLGEPGDERRAKLDEALFAASAANRKQRARRAGDVA